MMVITSEEISWYVLWEEMQLLLANDHQMNEKWATFQWATKKKWQREQIKQSDGLD